jgi:predicted ester cyclase
MTRDSITDFFTQWDEAWRARDPDRLAAVYAPQATVVSPMFKHLRGRAEIAESYYRLFESFPDWTVTNEEPLIDGERIARVFEAHATHAGDFMGLKPTKRRCQIQGVRLFRLGADGIEDERRLYDFTNLLIQIGVLKSKPGY